MKKSISNLEDRNLKINQKEEERNQRIKTNKRELQELALTIRRGDIQITGIFEREEKEQRLESIFRQIVDKNFPNLRFELQFRIQEVNRTPN